MADAAANHPHILAWALRTRREELGLSQNELAKRANVQRGYISEVERGEKVNLSWETLEKWVAALETTTAGIFRLAGSVEDAPGVVEPRDTVTLMVTREKAGPLKRLERLSTPRLLAVEDMVRRFVLSEEDGGREEP